MTAITLAQAQTQLTEALAALSAARKAQGYSISDRSLQRARVEELQADVGFWEKRVNELTAEAAGATNSGYIVPRFY